jgi:hypothetical protein
MNIDPRVRPILIAASLGLAFSALVDTATQAANRGFWASGGSRNTNSASGAIQWGSFAVDP